MRIILRETYENLGRTGDMVEVTEFPQLAYKYAVRGVPKTVVNEKPGIEGMLREGPFLDAILGLAQQEGS